VDHPDALSEELREREISPRTRKNLSELVLNWEQFS